MQHVLDLKFGNFVAIADIGGCMWLLLFRCDITTRLCWVMADGKVMLDRKKNDGLLCP
ncbi:MAG: hypothetical protein JRI95_12245 [Deltaproteobacteria bacterium]|nr:hypothetical protein [Deltaproteobacteria bacterium]MBW2086932.1 hypothetical protein [Deltaproteobacteria bacterium]